MNFLPSLASTSMLYPGDGSFDSPSTRAKRSRQLPTAMSIVSPKMRYLPRDVGLPHILNP